MLVRLIRLLSSSRSRKPNFLGCGCGSLVVFLALGIAIAVLISRCVPNDSEAGQDELQAEAAPRLLLSRVWFDKLPEKRTDAVDLWIFFGGGIGLHETGSSYRLSLDVFEFERRGSKLDASYLHDKKRFKTGFEVRSCHDHPPFDLCLTLNDIGGKKVELYGFGHDEEMERAVPGSRATLEAARARAGGSTGPDGSY